MESELSVRVDVFSASVSRAVLLLFPCLLSSLIPPSHPHLSLSVVCACPSLPVYPVFEQSSLANSKLPSCSRYHRSVLTLLFFLFGCASLTIGEMSTTTFTIEGRGLKLDSAEQVQEFIATI